ncbi:MAG: hypothetical protein GY799_14070 [Desulfobulbaceae bacterium]|nr:hypothetical protein [Desulfobulbaceae bacterium]
MKTKICLKCILMTLSSLLLLFYLSGCAAKKQDMLDSGVKQLSSEELKSLFSEKRIAKNYVAKKTRWYTFTYFPDGSITIDRKGRTRNRAYTIDNDRLCLKSKPTSRKKKCSSWLKIDNETYYTYGKDGSLIDQQTFQ